MSKSNKNLFKDCAHAHLILRITGNDKQTQNTKDKKGYKCTYFSLTDTKYVIIKNALLNTRPCFWIQFVPPDINPAKTILYVHSNFQGVIITPLVGLI